MTTVDSLLKDGMRALFAFGITQDFFSASPSEIKEIGKALQDAFSNLEERFGVKVLGTFDDDLLQCGATGHFPWISYILVDLPNLEAAIAITNLVRTPFGEARLAKYVRLETRIGHPLFFGTK